MFTIYDRLKPAILSGTPEALMLTSALWLHTLKPGGRLGSLWGAQWAQAIPAAPRHASPQLLPAPTVLLSAALASALEQIMRYFLA